ncbi:MAG: hypothetical protein ACOX6M_04935 [Armatimonadota bacterium]|jgi:cytosine/uracil/thiamine/allantoin permease
MPCRPGGLRRPRAAYCRVSSTMRFVFVPFRLFRTPQQFAVFVGVAAVRLGRRFVGIEISADYLQMARRRIEREAGRSQRRLLSAPTGDEGL